MSQKKIDDAIVMGHQKWTHLIKKYRSRVPSTMIEKFEQMAKDQERMTQEFNERVRSVSHLDEASKKAAMKKIGKWYELKDAELFDRHHWSSCWLMGQLVHKEFKHNAVMNEQFKQHCPKMFKKQKEVLSTSSWGKYTNKQIPAWAFQQKKQQQQPRYSTVSRVSASAPTSYGRMPAPAPMPMQMQPQPMQMQRYRMMPMPQQYAPKRHGKSYVHKYFKEKEEDAFNEY